MSETKKRQDPTFLTIHSITCQAPGQKLKLRVRDVHFRSQKLSILPFKSHTKQTNSLSFYQTKKIEPVKKRFDSPSSPISCLSHFLPFSFDTQFAAYSLFFQNPENDGQSLPFDEAHNQRHRSWCRCGQQRRSSGIGSQAPTAPPVPPAAAVP